MNQAQEKKQKSPDPCRQNCQHVPWKVQFPLKDSTLWFTLVNEHRFLFLKSIKSAPRLSHKEDKIFFFPDSQDVGSSWEYRQDFLVNLTRCCVQHCLCIPFCSHLLPEALVVVLLHVSQMFLPLNSSVVFQMASCSKWFHVCMLLPFCWHLFFL